MDEITKEKVILNLKLPKSVNGCLVLCVNPVTGWRAVPCNVNFLSFLFEVNALPLILFHSR